MNFALTLVAFQAFDNLLNGDQIQNIDYFPFKFSNETSQEHLAVVINSNEVKIYESYGDGTFSLQKYSGLVPCPINICYNKDFLSLDTNGDGLSDLLQISTGNGEISMTIWQVIDEWEFFKISEGYKSVKNYQIYNRNFKSGDFNGDGKQDIMHINGDSIFFIWASIENNKFHAYDKNIDFNNLNSKPIYIGKIDYDKRDDILHLYSDQEIKMYISGINNSFVSKSFKIPVEYAFTNKIIEATRVADFNGDGLLDILHVYKKNRLRMLLNNGNYTFKICPSFPDNGYDLCSNNCDFKVADFNGDKKADILHIYNEEVVFLWLSNGDGTFNFQPPIKKDNYLFSTNNYKTITGKFTNDNKTDIIHLHSNNKLVLWAANFIPKAENFTQNITFQDEIDFFNNIFDNEDNAIDLSVIILSLPTYGSLYYSMNIPVKVNKAYSPAVIKYKIDNPTNCFKEDSFKYVVEDRWKTRSNSAFVFLSLRNNTKPFSKHFSYTGGCDFYFSFKDFVFDNEDPIYDLKIKIISLPTESTLDICGYTARVNQSYQCMIGYIAFNDCKKNSVIKFDYAVIDPQPLESHVSTVTLYLNTDYKSLDSSKIKDNFNVNESLISMILSSKPFSFMLMAAGLIMCYFALPLFGRLR